MQVQRAPPPSADLSRWAPTGRSARCGRSLDEAPLQRGKAHSFRLSAWLSPLVSVGEESIVRSDPETGITQCSPSLEASTRRSEAWWENGCSWLEHRTCDDLSDSHVYHDQRQLHDAQHMHQQRWLRCPAFVHLHGYCSMTLFCSVPDLLAAHEAALDIQHKVCMAWMLKDYLCWDGHKVG